MEEECARYRCEGEDGSPITVLEFQYFGQAGTVRISVCGRAVDHQAAMALMKRSPKITANC
ncbi:hypothetical protein ACQKE8_25875, partial [Sphingobium limneticum]|uniref:hypothetical protein n=1 Tax=Sphingobium limneticum TaxID=1007511 RepID=UPI003CFDB33E